MTQEEDGKLRQQLFSLTLRPSRGIMAAGKYLSELASILSMEIKIVGSVLFLFPLTRATLFLPLVGLPV
jgi:hypothetical protein